MKFLLILFCTILFFSSCKEAIEDVKENAIIQIMVSGKWKVTKYIKGSADVTADFTNYQFQFYESKKVDALKNNAVEKTGTWQENTTDLSITSNFTNAPYPLTLLNSTFKITNTGLTFVEANATINGEVCLLRLDK